VNNLRLKNHHCNHIPCMASNTLLIKKNKCNHIPFVTFNTLLIQKHQCKPYTMCDIQHTIDQRALVSRSSSSTQPHRSSTHPPSYRNVVKDKSSERNNRNKGIERDFFEISTIAKCYKCKCQGDGHMTVNYPSLVKIAIIGGAPIEAPELE